MPRLRLDQFPIEVWETILMFFNLTDTVAFQQICKQFYRFYRSIESVWKMRVIETYKLSSQVQRRIGSFFHFGKSLQKILNHAQTEIFHNYHIPKILQYIYAEQHVEKDSTQVLLDL
jgi:hypothetical protein